MSRWSPVYVPEIETEGHVKNNACAVEIKIKWMIRKHMTYENTYLDEYILYSILFYTQIEYKILRQSCLNYFPLF
jgi:hypothetical protein